MIFMLLYKRSEPFELQTLRSLKPRIDFSETFERHFESLVRGYEGEQLFDDMLGQLSINSLLLPDLNLESNRSFFQIDTLYFTATATYLFEVKNFQGEYYIEKDKWYASSGYEVQNPHLQIERAATLFRQVLQSMRVNILDLKCYIIFPNPQFTLFNAPRNTIMILPSQLPSFLEKINHQSQIVSKQKINIGHQLLSKRLDKSPYMRIPEFEYDQLKKGIFCPGCLSRMGKSNRVKFICSRCTYSEFAQDGVIRSLKAFELLFPNKTLTTKDIFDWCGQMPSKKLIQKVFSLYYKPTGQTWNTNYIKQRSFPKE
ncbi:nuclease-related domain-containing protein [Salipaludibacillus sp. HK11]|uniref:nuclease-related domain-containing protein n=1 Tax=Salipaludibacillus sp. HK11 TaxID=3394320 RepID=UPI0039FCAE73